MLSSPNDESPANIEAAVSVACSIFGKTKLLTKHITDCRKSGAKTIPHSRRRFSVSFDDQPTCCSALVVFKFECFLLVTVTVYLSLRYVRISDS